MMIGPVEVARYLGCSLQVVQYRAATGSLRPARRRPTLKFRIQDVIEHARTAPPVRAYTRRQPLPPSALDHMNDKLAALLANAKEN